MTNTFNAFEILEMAEEIERNGAKFYRQAAKNTSDKKAKQMLLGMADMETGHLETFHNMKAQLSDKEKGWSIYDPDDISALYLQVLADAHGYEGKISPTKELTGDETMKEILEIALNSEKKSVLFYFGLKESVPPKAGRDKVEAIIKEEVNHIKALLDRLNSL